LENSGSKVSIAEQDICGKALQNHPEVKIMSATKWEMTTRSAATLSLDSKNPRLAQITNQALERQLIEELVNKEDVYSLAKSIAESGYFASEVLVAVREGSKMIVVEGNRRLTACKLLISPEAAPVSEQGRFRNLSHKTNLAALKEIPVCIAPSREATYALVLKRHTKLPIAKWEPVMQSKFYRQLIATGMSIQDIAIAAGQGEAEVRSSLRDHHLYEMACRLSLPNEIAGKVNDPHLFSLSTLGRIFDVPEARLFFGVDVDDKGEIVGSIPEAEFTKGFEKVVTDIADGKTVTSRSLNKSADVARYLSTFPQDCKPNVRRKGTFTAATFRSSEKPKIGPASPKKHLGSKPGTRQPGGLIPNTVSCKVKNRRVQNLFAELRRLSPETYPNASALAFRALLEMSVYCYLDSKGEIQLMAQEYKQEIANYNKLNPAKPPKQTAADWTPNLNAMINRLRENGRGLIPSGHITKALKKAVDDEKELFGLNLYTHNITYHPDGPRLRGTWARFEELLKVILA
jgi:hypothetical protein